MHTIPDLFAQEEWYSFPFVKAGDASATATGRVIGSAPSSSQATRSWSTSEWWVCLLLLEKSAHPQVLKEAVSAAKPCVCRGAATETKFECESEGEAGSRSVCTCGQQISSHSLFQDAFNGTILTAGTFSPCNDYHKCSCVIFSFLVLSRRS